MQMTWGGVVDWTPDAKVRIAEATDEISRRLEVDDETANRLWEGMSDVDELMAIKGLCAYPGGEQSVRVIPETLEFARTERLSCLRKRLKAGTLQTAQGCDRCRSARAQEPSRPCTLSATGRLPAAGLCGSR
jgi:hypothetical protein